MHPSETVCSLNAPFPCVLRQTDDFYPLSVLFRQNGMGVEIEKNTPDRVLKMWRVDRADTGELLAAVTLEIRDGVFALGDIAVSPVLRGFGCGTMLQRTVFGEARQRGAREIWACAKEPAYYLRCGWQREDWDTSPDLAVYCTTCGKRGNACSPEKMRYVLK